MEVNLHPLGINAVVPLQNLTIPTDSIPIERITGDIVERGGAIRCKLQYLKILNQGTYGTIQQVRRITEHGTQLMVCKKRTEASDKRSLFAEGIVQRIAHDILSEIGLIGAIPEVYDIFMHGDECRFTMEYIDGQSALDAIYQSAEPDLIFIQCLAQVCIILGELEEKIFLDHRDLKMTNLWVRKSPVVYTTNIHGTKATFSFPFQVVVLDFGFACIGNGEGTQIVNLGGVIPNIDPCPKNGRDLYQCIMSLWSVEQVRSRLSDKMLAEIKSWLQCVKGSNMRITDSSTSLEWTYMLTSHPKFNHNPLRPEQLLKTLIERWLH